MHQANIENNHFQKRRKEKQAESARNPPFSKLLSVFWIVWLIVFSISCYRECH